MSETSGSSRTRLLITVLEVTGVFIVGHSLSSILSQAAGFQPLPAILREEFVLPEPDYFRLATAMTRVLLIQYACLLTMAFGFWRLTTKVSLRDFGIGAGNSGLVQQLRMAIAAFVVATVPLKTLLVIHSFVSLGEDPPMWIIFSTNWSMPFWVFAAVGSFILVPIFEELLYRGYFQSRIAEVTKPGLAVIMVAVMFILTHSQYHQLSILSMGTVFGLAFVALAMGCLYILTGSLIAPIVFHALINFPIKPDLQLPVLLVMLIFLFLLRKDVLSFLKKAWELLGSVSGYGTLATLAVILIMAVAPIMLALFPNLALLTGISSLAVVICYRYKDWLSRLYR